MVKKNGYYGNEDLDLVRDRMKVRQMSPIEHYFLNFILTIKLLIKYRKKFITMVHIVIMVTLVTYA